MKTVSTALQNLLLEYLQGKRNTYYIAELYVFWLNFGLSYNAGFFNNGHILAYTGCDTDLTIGSNIYKHLAIEHDDIMEQRGVETNNTSIKIYYSPDDKIQQLNITWLQALKSGVFDACYVSIDRLYSPTPIRIMMGNISSDYVLKGRFFGRIDVDEAKISSATLTVKAPTELLNTQLPRNEVIPTCINTFCDSMCTLNKQNYSYSVSAQAGSTKVSIATGLSKADGFFNQGSMLCLSGNNIGTTRTIKSYANNVAVPVQPWGESISAGDSFTIYQGCSKTMAGCESYNNLTHFRGFPYLPVQNTLL